MFRYKLVLEKLQRKERKYSEVPVGRNRSFRRYTTSEERTIWLKADQKTYEDRLILPGELYKVTLNSMTSEEQACLRPPRGFFLSRPGPPGKVRPSLGDLVHISFSAGDHWCRVWQGIGLLEPTPSPWELCKRWLQAGGEEEGRHQGGGSEETWKRGGQD